MNDFKKILPSLLISVVLVAAIFYYFDVRAMLGKFASANPVYLIAAPFFDPDFEQYPEAYRNRAAVATSRSGFTSARRNR
mgnify:CR=1 FL=1